MSLAEGMAFVLYVGAARAAATPAQCEQLRARMPAALQVYRDTGSEGPMRAAIRDVMGSAWEPSGDWKKALDQLSRRRPQ